MKLSKCFMLASFFVLGSLTMSMFGQSNLNKWIAKCEATEGVDVTVINRRNRETKVEESKMTSISFSNNATLMTELKDAVALDRKDAIEVMENKKGGVLQPQIYEFYDANKKETTKFIFSFSPKNENKISVVVQTEFQNGK